MITKGPQEGYCNICSKYTQLTRDHIPPQGCITPAALELRTLNQHISYKNRKPLFSQNGLNIRSICGQCNNTLLGTNYDPELISLSRQLANLVRVQNELGFSLPQQVSLRVKPQKLARSVIGHVLAGTLPSTSTPPISAPFPDALKRYFLDSSSPMPNELDVYYWIYPSRQQIVINYLALALDSGKGFIAGSSLLKFFPLAFWIVWNKPNTFSIDFPKLLKNKSLDLDEPNNLIVDLTKIPHLSWPEVPDGNQIVMYRDELTVLARPKRPKGVG